MSNKARIPDQQSPSPSLNPDTIKAKINAGSTCAKDAPATRQQDEKRSGTPMPVTRSKSGPSSHSDKG